MNLYKIVKLRIELYSEKITNSDDGLNSNR